MVKSYDETVVGVLKSMVLLPYNVSEIGS